jgi:ribosomal-protein-serine acetyltransferase
MTGDPAPILVDAATRLRPWQPADATPLFEAVEASHDHIAEWLTWADGYTLDRARTFIAACRRAYGTGEQLDLCLEVDGAIAGGCGFVKIDRETGEGEIGYWLGLPYTGRGLMTRAVAALTDHGFEAMALHRVVIAMLAGNRRSRAIPERLGFSHEGTFRESRLHRGTLHDIAWYAMLARDWRPPA